MHKLSNLLAYSLALFLTFSISGCGGGGGGGDTPPPPAGTLNLTIIDASIAHLEDGSIDPLAGIADANVLLLDGAGDPVHTFTSNADGVVTQANLTPGSYQLKVSAQGFKPSPAPRVPPLPVVIVDDQTTSVTIELRLVDEGLILGAITGTVTDTTANTVAGVLVIAEVDTESYTTITDSDGNYILHNVAEGSAVMTAFISGLNFSTLDPVTVTVDAVTADQDIIADSVAIGSIGGNLNFVAGGSQKVVDVTLIDRETREVIPGMRVETDDSSNYIMIGLPDGNFEIIASMENDGIVIDPDESVTQGDPIVIVTDGVVKDEDGITLDTKSFKVTGAIEVGNPPTPVNNIIPEVETVTPIFKWLPYPSTSNYTIEVVNESGDTFWGGFQEDGLGPDPVQGIPQVTVVGNIATDADGYITIEYNSDGLGETLELGRYYQLRIYAMKDVTVSADYPQGFKLISTTENLNGIFKVAEPALAAR